MDNLIFSLNATIPVFAIMLLGVFLRKINWMDEAFALKVNAFVFKVSLPAMLFVDLGTVDFVEAWNTKFVLFCMFATLASVAVSLVIARFAVDRPSRGEFVQSAYRSSSAILGIAFIKNIYGTSSVGPLMILASVPIYNIVAVSVLTIYGEKPGKMSKELVKKTLIGIATNPIILGIVAGFVWSLLGIGMPTILYKMASSVGSTTTPMGLIAMGAIFDLDKAFAKAKTSVIAAGLKLLAWCALFIPVASLLGFRNEQMVAILIMLGSPTTVASFTMAKNMGHDGVVSSSTVMLTTMISAFTLTLWLFLIKSMGLI